MGTFIYHTKYIFVEKVEPWIYYWRVMKKNIYYGVPLTDGSIRASSMSEAERKVKIIMDRNPNRWR